MDIQEKRKLAHEYALIIMADKQYQHAKTFAQIAEGAWNLADAMEAQEKQRITKGLPDVLRNDGA